MIYAVRSQSDLGTILIRVIIFAIQAATGLAPSRARQSNDILSNSYGYRNVLVVGLQ